MKNKRLIISWIAVLLWMGLIFFMSNQPGSVSSKQSDLVVKLLTLLGISFDAQFSEVVTLIVRKGAHFTEYFILYVLSYNLIKQYSNSKMILIYSLILVLAYSISDEIHQYFIPGRAMSIKDVLIDLSGGISAMIINNFRLKMNEKNIEDIKRKIIYS